MLVFYLAALDSDDNKNKFETIYRKYYRFMLHTAAALSKIPRLLRMPYMETFVQRCARSTPCASTTSGR